MLSLIEHHRDQQSWALLTSLWEFATKASDLEGQGSAAH